MKKTIIALSTVFMGLLGILGYQSVALGATPAMQVFQGGTGSSTLSGILYGNGTSSVRTVTIGSNLTFSAGTLSASGGSGSFPFSADTNYGAQVYSTGTPTLWLKNGVYASSTSHFVDFDFTNATGSKLSLSGLTLNQLVVGGGSTQALTTTSTPAFPAGSLTLSKIGAATYSTLQHLMNLFNSPGNTSGGTFSTSSGNVAVAAGTGLIKASDSNVAEMSFMDYAASSTVTLGATTTRYIGVEYNSGTPRVVHKSTQSWDYDTDYPLGTAVTEGNTVWAINRPWITGDTIANILERFDSTAYIARDNRAGGLILSNTGTRNIAITAGALLSRMSEYTIAAIDTSVSGSCDAYYNGGANFQRAQTTWDNSNYDNAGTLTTLTVLAYTSRWFYVMSDGTCAYVYGTTQDMDFADILDESPPSTLPARISETGMLIGRFIIRASATTPALTQSAFGTAFTAGSVSNHTDLAGLSWSSSGHTGTANSLASFNSAGAAISVATSTFNVGALTAATSLTVTPLTSAIMLTNGSGDFAEYAGASCTNQFVRSLSALGAATCATVGTADVAGLDISDDTNLAVTFPITLSGDTIGFTATSSWFTTNSTSTASFYSNLLQALDARVTNLTATSGVTFADGNKQTRGSFTFGATDVNATTTDIFTMQSFPYAVTIQSISGIIDCPNGCHNLGTPGITVKFWHGTNRSASTTATALFTNNQTFNSTTTLQTFSTGFNDATLAAGEILWYQITGASTTQMSIDFTGVGTND